MLLRLSHLLGLRMPFYRDKQLSQPTPSGIIDNTYRQPMVANGHAGIIHPTWTLRCGIF